MHQMGDTHATECPPSASKVVFRYYMQKCYVVRTFCHKWSVVILTLLAIMFCFSKAALDSYPVRAVCPSSNGAVIPRSKFLFDNATLVEFAPPNRHLPHCIIIGAKKTGTRALSKFLSIHPEIVPASKEKHFFDNDAKYKKGLKFYLESMPYSFSGQMTVEKTAAYFNDIRAPERISNMNSSIKLLLMVREPVLRLVSDYSQLREAAKKANKTYALFEKHVLDNDREVDTSYKPVQISMYNNYIKRWLKHFSWKQIHIIDGDQFEVDPYSEIYKIESFLGVGHLIKRENFFLNETKGFFCINGGGPISPCLQNFKRAKYPYVAPKLVKKLYNFYRPYNREFFKVINKDFKWDNMNSFLKTQDEYNAKD